MDMYVSEVYRFLINMKLLTAKTNNSFRVIAVSSFSNISANNDYCCVGFFWSPRWESLLSSLILSTLKFKYTLMIRCQGCHQMTKFTL